MNSRPIGVRLLTGFFSFGALMCSLTILLLLFPGTQLDAVWRINPEARAGFAAIGPWAFLVMLVGGGGCALAAIGLGRGTRWGQRVAVAMLSVNLLADLLNALFRHDPRTLIGLPIAGLMIAYLCSRGFASSMQKEVAGS